MKKLFKIEWRLDDMSPQDILLALRKYNPIWQVLSVTEILDKSQNPCFAPREVKEQGAE